MALPMALEGDGIIENLFYYLWCKDDFGEGPNIHIPHTILFKFTQPLHWYFTSKSGKVKRKSKVNVTNAHIDQEFTRNKSSADVVAYYIYLDEQGAPIIEYFDLEGFREFLYKREKINNGILQRFVVPKGTSNAMIRVIWSPKICLLERRLNLRNLYDKRFTAFERAVTFDGPEIYSRPEPVRGAMLPGDIQLLCEQIVDHVTQVSYHNCRISRMVLHLKADSDDNLWLLWSSSLRLVQKSGSNAKINPLDVMKDPQIPLYMRPQIIEGGDTARPGFVMCTSCAGQVESKKVLYSNYKAVLEHYDRFMSFVRHRFNYKQRSAIEWPPDQNLIQAAGGVGFGVLALSEKKNRVLTQKDFIIPPIIQYLHPNLSLEDFERHRRDPIFLHRTIAVCESCYLVYSDYTTSSLEMNSIRQNAPAILRPMREIPNVKHRLHPVDMAKDLTVNTSSVDSMQKPLPSAWKPVALGKKRPSKFKHKNSLLNFHAAPQLPERIKAVNRVVKGIATLENGIHTNDDANGNVSSMEELHMREEKFFEEIYGQKSLDKNHPLQHMLDSATRINTKSNGTGILATMSDSSILGTVQKHTIRLPELGLMGKKKAHKSPYSVKQCLVVDDVDSQQCTHGASSSKFRTQKLQGESTRENESSLEHKEFLYNALSEAQLQLKGMDKIPSNIGSPIAKEEKNLLEEVVLEGQSVD